MSNLRSKRGNKSKEKCKKSMKKVSLFRNNSSLNKQALANFNKTVPKNTRFKIINMLKRAVLNMSIITLIAFFT